MCVSPELRGTLWLVRTSFSGLGLDCTVEITGRHLVVIVKVEEGGLGIVLFLMSSQGQRDTCGGVGWGGC